MNVPTHLGVILDGNRRFAKELLKRPWEGHKIGLVKARDVLEWACDAGVKYVTAYTLSFENLKTRPKRELQMILSYLEKEMDTILSDKNHIVHRSNVKVKFIGRINLLPQILQEKMKKVEEKTSNYKKHFLNIAVAYGGQQEIVDAVKKIVEKGIDGAIKLSELNEDMIKDNLYTSGQPYPDMIFRTGGEIRLSNFLPYQSVYSELIFTDKRWPELTKQDFDSALEEFSDRKRRFGK